jgi:pyruvate/2-oxoacid:ferredoxin oxidoreductase beta subunit
MQQPRPGGGESACAGNGIGIVLRLLIRLALRKSYATTAA